MIVGEPPTLRVPVGNRFREVSISVTPDGHCYWAFIDEGQGLPNPTKAEEEIIWTMVERTITRRQEQWRNAQGLRRNRVSYQRYPSLGGAA